MQTTTPHLYKEMINIYIYICLFHRPAAHHLLHSKWTWEAKQAAKPQSHSSAEQFDAEAELAEIQQKIQGVWAAGESIPW